MPSTATVAHRPRARWAARLPPARSICESSHPPKMSPLGLASAGIAMTRTSGMVEGTCEVSPRARDGFTFAVCGVTIDDIRQLPGRRQIADDVNRNGIYI